MRSCRYGIMIKYTEQDQKWEINNNIDIKIEIDFYMLSSSVCGSDEYRDVFKRGFTSGS